MTVKFSESLTESYLGIPDKKKGDQKKKERIAKISFLEIKKAIIQVKIQKTYDWLKVCRLFDQYHEVNMELNSVKGGK